MATGGTAPQSPVFPPEVSPRAPSLYPLLAHPRARYAGHNHGGTASQDDRRKVQAGAET